MTRPTMDFPQAWEFVRTTKVEDHHVKCSWRSGLLCDCSILWAEYYKRKSETALELNKRLRTALTNCSMELNYVHEHGEMSCPWKPQFLEVAERLLSD